MGQFKSFLMRITIFILCLLAIGCSTNSLLPTKHQFPDPVDTSDKPIELQKRMTYEVNGVSASNEYPGARLNGFTQISDHVFRAVISPENIPINISAYYSFQIWSDTTRTIELELSYTHHKHRYVPKLSYDGNIWVSMNTNDFDTLKAPNLTTLHLEVGPDKLYVSGQEVVATPQILAWTKKQANHQSARYSVIGKSKLGRDLVHLDIYEGSPIEKDAIIIFSRQHPPEVTGHFAMEAFVEELLADNRISNDFRKTHRILVYPCLNPDGVDEGHWRHNAGGIDLNRDWGEYRQEEIKAISKHIVATTKKSKNRVLVGLDFHSTQRDLYYTLTEDLPSSVFGFKDYWLGGIDQSFEDYTPDDRPNTLNQPITKGWFYLQFDAEGITYEIGDETPRPFIRKKGQVAAQEMMKILLLE